MQGGVRITIGRYRFGTLTATAWVLNTLPAGLVAVTVMVLLPEELKSKLTVSLSVPTWVTGDCPVASQKYVIGVVAVIGLAVAVKSLAAPVAPTVGPLMSTFVRGI